MVKDHPTPEAKARDKITKGQKSHDTIVMNSVLYLMT
jgi:hypothetical protein